ncbi:hypothetical protein, partial [Acidithiobacillus ferridurans]
FTLSLSRLALNRLVQRHQTSAETARLFHEDGSERQMGQGRSPATFVGPLVKRQGISRAENNDS